MDTSVPLPAPDAAGATRRLSYTPSYNHGPRTPQALKAAIRYAAPFTYDNRDSTALPDPSFIQLPDPTPRFGPVRRAAVGSPPAQTIQEWLGLEPLGSSHKQPGIPHQCWKNTPSGKSALTNSSNWYTGRTDDYSLHDAVSDFRQQKKQKRQKSPFPSTASLSSTHLHP